jgi:Mg2+ and Co2+ transporter CorA
MQLAIGSGNLMDSAIMKRDARRATLLTLLAAINLPFSLVNGIFGMNVREINGSPLGYQACLATLGVMALSTIIFLSRYLGWRKREWLLRAKNKLFRMIRRFWNAGMPCFQER